MKEKAWLYYLVQNHRVKFELNLLTEIPSAIIQKQSKCKTTSDDLSLSKLKINKNFDFD